MKIIKIFAVSMLAVCVLFAASCSVKDPEIEVTTEADTVAASVENLSDAIDAFADARQDLPLNVVLEEPWLSMIPQEKRQALIQVLSLNPRPGYQHDPNRRYGFLYAGFDVRFTIEEDTLRVVEVVKQ